jgi:hypothetical protein
MRHSKTTGRKDKLPTNRASRRVRKPNRADLSGNSRAVSSSRLSRRSGQPAPEARARELAAVARDLDQHKSDLPYGAFEKWALKTHPAFPIQVMRYLRKAQGIFGGDLERLLERYGQKKVFLLLGLSDPWSAVREGIPHRAGRDRVPLKDLSVKQLRSAIQLIVRAGKGRSGERQQDTVWGNLSTSIERLGAIWPSLKESRLGSGGRSGPSYVRQRLKKFRSALEDTLGKVNAVLETRGAASRNLI